MWWWVWCFDMFTIDIHAFQCIHTSFGSMSKICHHKQMSLLFQQNHWIVQFSYIIKSQIRIEKTLQTFPQYIKHIFTLYWNKIIRPPTSFCLKNRWLRDVRISHGGCHNSVWGLRHWTSMWCKHPRCGADPTRNPKESNDVFLWQVYPLVNWHNYGKSPFLMGKLTISMVIFHCHVWLLEGTNKTLQFPSQYHGGRTPRFHGISTFDFVRNPP